METQTIQATPRGKQSHGVLARMRKSGQTAVTFSGKGMTPVALSVPTIEIERAIRGRIGKNMEFLLGVQGESHLVRFAQVDRHPIGDTLLSVSLQKVIVD